MVTKAHLESRIAFFDRTSIPPSIAELLDQWVEIDPATQRLIRDAISSRSRARMQLVFELLSARSELAAQVHR